jgi:2-polyprenyl-3-methyl-5-hydroxy-6-metoxy-1,4-benzoquinol methylase
MDAQNSLLIEAVARYCFNTDYIFNRTEAEENKIEALRRELESDAGARQDVVKTGLFACYEPFYKLKTVAEMALLPDVKAQLEDYLDLQARAAKIPSLTEINDPVSLKVRKQYEEFPYPRWRELPISTPVEGRTLDCMQILVAGCGTGQEPLILGQSCPKATILAIDLSRTSLAYASRKAEELGIKNVTFKHADILQLGSLTQKFDCICSGGVLHHMKDPVAGWKVLVGLLKPHGLMRIGLYSALARRAITAAREIIRAENYPDTAAGMRRFRQESAERLGSDEIWDAMDYYHLNMYRDLLFHVQEYQFTLPQLQKTLDDLGLEFLAFFDLPPQQTKGETLADWNKLEEANPSLFSRMYQFWCRKKA